MPENIIQIDQNLLETRLDRLVAEKVAELLNAMLDAEADEIANAAKYERTGEPGGLTADEIRHLNLPCGSYGYESEAVDAWLDELAEQLGKRQLF